MSALVRIVVGVLLTGCALVAVPLAPAGADNGCPGAWDVRSDYLTDVDGYRVARLYGYRNGSGWCYSLVSEGRYRGVAKYMSFTVCNSDRQGCLADTGTYTTYAGPLQKPGTCVWTVSLIRDPSDRTILRRPAFFGSCD